MFLGRDIRDLSSLLSLPDVVTFVAVLAGMGSVGEYRLENVPRLRSAAIRCDRMADAAFADLALGRVAPKAVVVGLKANGDVPARSGEVMTSRAALCGSGIPAVVHRVIELHVEALNELYRECLDLMRVACDVLMADRTHRLSLGARELAKMTTDTRLMAWVVHL